MCRILAYFGPELRASALLEEPPHGLVAQSRAAKEMHGGSVAGDGWGLGWFAPGVEGAPPGMFKGILPLWGDENVKTAAQAIVSRAIVAHARLASPGLETCFTNTPLFVMGDHLVTINGEMQPWPCPLAKALRDRLDPDDWSDLRGATDGEVLAALWHTGFRRSGSRDEADGLRAALRTARNLAREYGGSITTNVIVAGADGFVAAKFADPGPPNSLYWGTDLPSWPGATIVASEPLDSSPGWRAVEPMSLVRANADGPRIEPLWG